MKQNTSIGQKHSGPNQTRDHDDAYGAGDSREYAKRSDDKKYENTKPRVGGRKREDETDGPNEQTGR